MDGCMAAHMHIRHVSVCVCFGVFYVAHIFDINPVEDVFFVIDINKLEPQLKSPEHSTEKAFSG